jgi:hypothetical protein
MILYFGTSMYMYFSDRIRVQNDAFIKELLISMNKLSLIELDEHKELINF